MSERLRYRFNAWSDEEACAAIVPGTEQHDGGWLCQRRKGHAPPCLTLPGGADVADGVHYCCGAPMEGSHHKRCQVKWTEVKL